MASFYNAAVGEKMRALNGIFLIARGISTPIAFTSKRGAFRLVGLVPTSPSGRRDAGAPGGQLSDKGLRAMNGVFWVAIAVFSQAYGAAGRP